MADADDVRRLALALPHVTEIDSDGFDFRVADKGFIWSYPERKPGQRRVIRTDIAVLFVGDEAEKQALLLGEPEVFFTAPGYDGWPLVLLRPGYDGWPLVLLRLAEVDAGRLAELVTDAWRMRAPAALVGQLDQAGAGPPPRRENQLPDEARLGNVGGYDTASGASSVRG
ncbi:MAG: MmcQ/YjbR family DNA-binding protein [Streptosporangiaceae bacterium]